MSAWAVKWKNWWVGQSRAERLVPAGLGAIYLGILWAAGQIKPEHVGPTLGILALYYSGPRARELCRFFFPLYLASIIYDSQRWWGDYVRAEVRVKEPYLFDKLFFGIRTPDGVLTPNEWWQLHTSPWLDVITGFFYIAFIPMFLAFAAYFRFVLPWRRRDPDFATYGQAVMWAFFWVNMIGYSTYYWFPAAPPWYVAEYGLGPARLDVMASAAGCVRFDQALGTHIFTEWYGRSADVFGAIPSLHVAYPLQAVYFAFRFGSARLAALVFYAMMCFSAVYLNHHYVLDILWGSVYALGVCWAVDLWYSRKMFRAVAVVAPA